MKYDVVVVGAGFAGSVIANRFASDNKKVLIIEKRSQIGGNMYDFIDESNVRYHKYGPHIFHTSNKKVVDFLSNYTKWYKYEHRVLGKVCDKLVPIPFNLTSIEEVFENDKANKLKSLLIETYGMETKVPILELRKNENSEIKELAEFIYENVFKYYTMKQWGLSPEEIDPAVTGRVPVHISYDDRYFQDEYQQMPKDGFTSLFENLLASKNIEILLKTECKDVLKFDTEKNKIYLNDEEFSGKVIYTGAIDELFDYTLGELPYRSLEFVSESHKGTYQKCGTVNYPTPSDENEYTRITEYKHLMEDDNLDMTTIAIEYPYPYNRNSKKGNIPYYPIFTKEIEEKYKEYVKLSDNFKNLYLLGRLAEFRYYNMDAIVDAALNLYEKLKGL